jgi:hypothetical protein
MLLAHEAANALNKFAIYKRAGRPNVAYLGLAGVLQHVRTVQSSLSAVDEQLESARLAQARYGKIYTPTMSQDRVTVALLCRLRTVSGLIPFEAEYLDSIYSVLFACAIPLGTSTMAPERAKSELQRSHLQLLLNRVMT